MLSAVSSVSFRGDTAKNQDIINAPGKFSNPQPKRAPKPDTFESPENENKHTTAKVIGTIVGLAALAWIGLGIAVGRKGSNWKKIEKLEGEELKRMDKVKNFFFSIGESANNAFKKVFKRGETKTTETKPETK